MAAEDWVNFEDEWEYHDERTNPRFITEVTCKLCGTRGLQWHRWGDKWRLTLHECNKRLTVSRPDEFPNLTEEV